MVLPADRCVHVLTRFMVGMENLRRETSSPTCHIPVQTDYARHHTRFQSHGWCSTIIFTFHSQSVGAPIQCTCLSSSRMVSTILRAGQSPIDQNLDTQVLQIFYSRLRTWPRTEILRFLRCKDERQP